MTGGHDVFQPAAGTDIVLLRLVVAAALGGLIGIERERAEGTGSPQFAGVRTFPLFSVLGAVLALASGQIGPAVIAGFVAVAALVVVSYLRSSRSDIGTTTETAALATYWVGVLAGAGALLLAAVLGIGMTVLLASKERLEAFPRGLSRDEVQAALVLAVIAAVVLPLLPDARYGPWGVWNPRHLWGMVVLVCGLSFVAFVGMRIWGEARGLYASGLLGGLVSSTAVMRSGARLSRCRVRRCWPGWPRWPRCTCGPERAGGLDATGDGWARSAHPVCPPASGVHERTASPSGVPGRRGIGWGPDGQRPPGCLRCRGIRHMTILAPKAATTCDDA